MRNPKTLKEIPIEGHTRKTPKGGITTIDPHFAKREVNVNDELKSFHNKASELRKELFTSDGNLKLSENDTASKIMDLYKKDGNGFDINDLKISDNALSEVLRLSSDKFLGCEDNKYMQSINMRELANMVTHPDYINEVHLRTKMIKDKFDKAGITTKDYIDPFSFGIEKTGDKDINYNEIEELFSKNIYNKLTDVMNDNGDVLGHTLFMDRFRIDGQISDVLKSGMFNNRKFTSTILPSLIIPNMIHQRLATTTTPTYDKNYLNNSRKDVISLSSGITDEFIKEMNVTGGGIIFGNVANIRKRTIDKVSKIQDDIGLDKGKEILNFFSKVDDAHLIPAVNITAKKGVIPTQMLSDKKLLKDVQKISESMRGVLSGNFGKNVTISATISKSPFALLTMSPNENIQSCQSIVSYNGDQITVGGLNANVTGAYNTHRTNDFIVFKNNNKGQKVARMSLNYDQRIDKFRYFEDSPVYGDGAMERRDLKAIINNNKSEILFDDLFRDKEEERGDSSLSAAINIRISSIRNEIEHSETPADLERVWQPNRDKQLLNEIYRGVQKEFSVRLNNTGDSMLYSSELNEFFYNLNLDSIKNKIDGLDKTYTRSKNYFGTKKG